MAGEYRDRVRHGPALAALVVVYLAVGLYPYTFEWPVVENGLRIDTTGLSFARPGILVTPAPPAWIDAVRAGHRVQVELRVRPHLDSQTGPARLLSLATDHRSIGFMLGQEGDAVVVRLHDPREGASHPTEWRVPGMLAAGRWTELDLRVDRTVLRLAVDGATRLEAKVPEAALATLPRHHRLAVGNAVVGERAWLGDVARAVVRTPLGAADYAKPSPALRPRWLRVVHETPRVVPFANLTPFDAFINSFGFLPFGAAIVLWARRSRLRDALVAGIALSATIEIVQFLLPGRFPSVTDLLLNAAGAVVGSALARSMRGAIAAPPTPR